MRYLVTNNENERMAFIKRAKPFGKRIAIFNKIPLRDTASYFDKSYNLIDLYKDEIFLKLLSDIDRKTSIFLMDLGLDYCSFKGDYIKAYTRLHPICSQAKDTFIIDGFAFYNTEKSIYRPFLYIDDKILDSSVHEFYNVGAIYKDFEGNKVENYYQKIKPYIKISNNPIELEKIFYTPTKTELKKYGKLKKELILENKYPKQKVINELLKFIDNSKTKKNTILPKEDGVLDIIKNNKVSRIKMYKTIILENPKKVRFYSSGVYGADELELSRTYTALERHNKLIELINGKESI